LVKRILERDRVKGGKHASVHTSES
jgi:hypothetical protein